MGQPAERVVVQHPQAVQEGREAIGVVYEVGEIEVAGDLAPGPRGYLIGIPAGPQHVLDRVARRGIQWQLAHQDALRRHRQIGVRQGSETGVDAFAFRALALAGRFRQAETFARLTKHRVRVSRETRDDDAFDQLTQRHKVRATRHHLILTGTGLVTVPYETPWRRGRLYGRERPVALVTPPDS